MLSGQPSLIDSIEVECFVFGVKKVDVGIPAVVIGETNIVALVINGLDRRWFP
jgi:hypothetical protein